MCGINGKSHDVPQSRQYFQKHIKYFEIYLLNHHNLDLFGIIFQSQV
jgi:hypothetical protein